MKEERNGGVKDWKRMRREATSEPRITKRE